MEAAIDLFMMGVKTTSFLIVATAGFIMPFAVLYLIVWGICTYWGRWAE